MIIKNYIFDLDLYKIKKKTSIFYNYSMKKSKEFGKRDKTDRCELCGKIFG
jgi:hypothetical protein